MPERIFNYEQRRLENDLIILELFNPDTHTGPFVDEINAHPELFKYISFPPISTPAEFLDIIYHPIAASPEQCLYAIISKPSGAFAGTLSLQRTSAENAMTEMGVQVFPAYQRMHVASNAIGLLLMYLLDPPSAGGLGLRRVEWKCHAENAVSRKVAARMGFEFEGIARWEKLVPPGPGGKSVGLPVEALQRRNGTEKEVSGRHTAIFSIVWDEWEGKRAGVIRQMGRTR